MKKFTYQELSRATGISIATISRVFNTPDIVAPGTRGKVIDAIVSMGLDPAAYGLLPDPADRLIIFNVPTLRNQFYSPIIEAARKIAESRGYILLINEADFSSAGVDQFLLLLSRMKACGTIIANAMTKESLQRISASLPVVTCCEAVPDSGVPFVSVDDEAAAYNAVRYIVWLGHRRIAMINGPMSFKYARNRLEGYKRVLEEEGIRYRSEYIAEIGSDMDFEVAGAAVMHMLNLAEPPDAFFCISDMLASAAIHAAIRRGCRVPEDISVVGFDNISISEMMNPSITTIKQPVAQLGALAAEMVIRMIEDKDEPLRSTYLGTELIIRESTRK